MTQEAASPPSLRKRMQVFRAADGLELDKEMMPFRGVDAGVIAGFGRLAALGIERGVSERTTVLFREPGDQGFSLVYAWFKSGYVLPRHSHDADCLYYVLAGSLKMGSQELCGGDGVFIPADHGYSYEVGPNGVEILEFRNATRFHINFAGNDDAHWDRMVAANRCGLERWRDEPAPSARTVAAD